MKNEKELKSVFIEILQKTPKNVIVDCIYRHPRMYPKGFNHLFLKSHRKNYQRKQQRVLLLGDFNIDLIMKKS